jgi:hypothetical protein
MLSSLYLRDVLRLVSSQIDVALSYPRIGSGPTTRPGRLFSRDAATPSSGVELSHPPGNESSLKTAVQGPSSPRRHDQLRSFTEP